MESLPLATMPGMRLRKRLLFLVCALSAACGFVGAQGRSPAGTGVGVGAGGTAQPVPVTAPQGDGLSADGSATQSGGQPGGSGASATGASQGASHGAGQATGSAESRQLRDRVQTRETAPRSSEELDQWLRSSDTGRALTPVRERLMAIASTAIAEGVPAEVFSVRLLEAGAKGVQAQVIMDAIAADAVSWRWLASGLQGAAWPPERQAASLYLAVGTALRNGLPRESVSALIQTATRQKMSADRAGAALATASATALAFRSGSVASLEFLASGVAGSRLRVGQFDDLVEIVRRAAAAGVTPDAFMAAFDRTIGARGSLAALERELF